jgi:eukaryotic-like serine/threonine-protein kinase
MALTSGTKLGPYEIQSPLGAGGMGEVYRARDTRLERTVAIKVLPHHLSSNPDLKQRFEREARSISSLNHPRICILHDVGHQDGVDFLVMEYLDGETLVERLRNGPLPLKEALRIGIEVCEALEAAQRVGIVHRDLKPGNIMLTKSGAKLMDFGLETPSYARAHYCLAYIYWAKKNYAKYVEEENSTVSSREARTTSLSPTLWQKDSMPEVGSPRWKKASPNS